ncbi:MAG: hypothetical protein JNL90_19205 [Planctomycetes bacterium]|nr:hypothetical protein [Planctomycetota bacterium]
MVEAVRVLPCVRCQTALQFLGTKRFHEGSHLWDVLGGFFAALEHRETFDLWACPSCGHVELFLEEVGAHLRGSRGPTLAEHLGRAVDTLLGRPAENPSPSINALPTWRCPKCDGTVPGSRDDCWRCWEPRPHATDRSGSAKR